MEPTEAKEETEVKIKRETEEETEIKQEAEENLNEKPTENPEETIKKEPLLEKEELLKFPQKPSLNKSGRDLPLVSNYFPFVFTDSSKNSIFKYAIEFEPELPGDSANLRRKIIGRARKNIVEVYGQFIFNNTVLFSLENRPEEKAFEVEFEGTKYKIISRWANYVDTSSVEGLPFYKKFFFSLLGHMNFIMFKRSYFDKSMLKKVQDIEIWPGFSPSINLFEGKILLNLNTLSKVIRTENALDYLKKLYQNFHSDQHAFQAKAKEDLKNVCVLTRYNNDKTFTLETIDFSLSPQSTFETKEGQITYINYYKKKYNKDIKDLNQPLLVSIDRKTKKTIHLIPEFCFLTGLTDEMRGNFNFMKQITQITIGQAHNKMVECINLVKSIIKNEKCKETSDKWGITISEEPISLTARKLDPGMMVMKKTKIPIDNTPDIDRKVQTEMFGTPSVKTWIIFFSRNISDIVTRTFIPQFQAAMRQFQFWMNKPQMVEVPSTRLQDWERSVHQNVTEETQFCLIIMPGQRGKGFFYNEIKTFFTKNIGIPVQIILEGTIKKDKGLRSIINKVLIQICAKMDGEPWVINDLPLTSKPTMLLSYCIYKDILTSCGTYNARFSKYTSRSTTLNTDCPLYVKIGELFKEQIAAFKAKLNITPSNVIILRDGVCPSSTTKMPIEEIKEIKRIIQELEIDIKFSYILVNKKHNLKVVFQEGSQKYANIPSGTLIDNVVVGNDYEYYLVSQKANQGISQATQYKIIYDDISLKPEEIHLLTYKMCFLYYNWTGGIKTPAPSHYAKKLAFLIGDKMTSKGNVNLPSSRIDSLYFL